MLQTKTPFKSQYDTKANDLAQVVLDAREDRVKRWKAVHKMLRYQNKKARKEQDVTAADCRFFREQGLVSKKKSEKMGLRWGVALPPMTYAALVQSDKLILGHSDLTNPNKEDHSDLKGSNQIVKDLQRAFPQYKVIK